MVKTVRPQQRSDFRDKTRPLDAAVIHKQRLQIGIRLGIKLLIGQLARGNGARTSRQFDLMRRKETSERLSKEDLLRRV